jgi:DNA-directed RNA polymerase I, II, and III subunit RPABC2
MSERDLNEIEEDLEEDIEDIEDLDADDINDDNDVNDDVIDDEDNEETTEEEMDRSKYINDMLSADMDSSEITVVKPENRITSDYMTLYEHSKIIGTRAQHIANGAPIYTDISGLSDPLDIAKKELDERKCPLSIVRRISKDKIEIWSANELHINK